MKELLQQATLSISGDSVDAGELIKRTTFLIISMLTVLAGLIWAGMYIGLGLMLAAIAPLAYSILLALGLGIALRQARYQHFVALQLTLIFILPLSLELILGGYESSGAVFMWSFLAPLGSALFQSAKLALRWFIAFIAGSITLVIAAPDLPSLVSVSSEFVVQIFFGMNLLGVVAIVFVAAQYFATQLESELKRSEDLLLNILPPSIAKRLKQGDDPIVDNFDGVTILFADLVGFTKASASLDPNFLIRYLNDVFAAFDTIAESSSLEKIKTIGDAYMVVGGLNDDTKDHAERVLDVAFGFQDALKAVNRAHKMNFKLRIGVHSGSVIAGVLGIRKFAYDIWGDAVNTASRMESHGLADEIQITTATFELVKHRFECISRGIIDVRGKGPVETFLVRGPVSNSDIHRAIS